MKVRKVNATRQPTSISPAVVPHTRETRREVLRRIYRHSFGQTHGAHAPLGIDSEPHAVMFFTGRRVDLGRTSLPCHVCAGRRQTSGQSTQRARRASWCTADSRDRLRIGAEMCGREVRWKEKERRHEKLTLRDGTSK